MTAGGVNEAIWHFAGYWHLADEVAQARLLYDGSALLKGSPDYAGGRPAEPGSPGGLDEFDTRKLHVSYRPKGDAFAEPDGPVLPEAAEDQAFSAAPAPSGGGVFPTLVIGGGSPDAFGIELLARGARLFDPKRLEREAAPKTERPLDYEQTYEPGGNDKIINIFQAKVLQDNDTALTLPGSKIAELQTLDAAETLAAMLDEAREVVPEDLALPPGGAPALPAFIEARDAARKAQDDEADEAGAKPEATAEEGLTTMVVEPGRYVDGVLTPEDPAAPEPEEPPAIPEPETPDQVGQVAELGSNEALNAALIVDTNEASTTFAVLGDYFSLNAIIQRNLVHDDDVVEHAGDPDAVVEAAGNEIQNIAEFIEAALDVQGAFGPTRRGLDVEIETVEGDFFDVKALTQKNWISDSDVVTQNHFVGYSTITAGANEQLSAAQLQDWSKQYDLIVVAGNYHKANLIYQTNLLIDDDIVMSAADTDEGEDNGSQAIHTGQNRVTNDATISTYGKQNFGEVGDDLSDLVGKLERGEDVPLADWWQFSGTADGTFDVLFVKGDYYDINVISQINVVVDMDTAAQFMPGAGTETPGSFIQFVTAGGNTLMNAAEIVDVNGTYAQYLGGKHYEDSILVQAEMIDPENDTIMHGDTQTLVSEVIAFTGTSEVALEEQDTFLTTRDAGSNADLFGGVMS